MTEFSKRAERATQAIRELFEATPLQRNDHLSKIFEADIWLKREDIAPVRSYKLRGAFTAMKKVLPEAQLFVCASAGNHAQGLAFACRHFNVKGVIFMPVTTPQQKIQKTRVFGGENIEIRLVGDYLEETLQASIEYCTQAGGHFMSPFDDEDVILGQASVAVECLAQMPKHPDMVIVPVGGGGLSAGMVSYFATEAPDIEMRFAEPDTASSLHSALVAGAPVIEKPLSNFVDGAAVACIGSNNFERLKSISPEHVIRIPEDRLCLTILDMLNTEGIVLEPAGALSIDALRDVADQIKGKTVLCVASGGNFDFERLPEVKERAQRYAGVKKYFILSLPQRPGALRDFLELLGPEDDIARFEYLKKSNRNFGSVLIGMETTRSENFHQLFGRLDEAGFAYRDITDDELLAQFLV